MEKTYLEFQKQQTKEKMAEREREKEEAKWYRSIAEKTAEEAKV